MSEPRHSHDGPGRGRARGPFGPLEALDEVQRQAVEAALRVTAELSALSGGLGDLARLGERRDAPSPNGEERPALDVGRLRGDIARATDTFADLLRALLDVGFDAVDELVRRPEPRSAGRAAPGETAEVVCTVRNGPDERRGLVPNVPQLTSGDGRVLAAEVRVEPTALDLQAHERAAVTVRVQVPPDAASGQYHGLLLVSGLPDAALPVTIEVSGDGG